jgi:uncharacterized protein (TIGR03435 family)
MLSDAQPAFEVAAIKPTPPGVERSFISMGRGGGNLFSSSSHSLKDLIVFAYLLHRNQIIGGPAWAENERYDVTGKPDTLGLPNVAQFQAMVRSLLTDRFGLTFHREKKELAVYTITIVNSEAKMAKSENSAMLPVFGSNGPGVLAIRNMTMTSFAEYIRSRFLDRPVVDQTGLNGRYDFQLHWEPDLAAGVPAASDVEPLPDIFTAFQQQLGLRLRATRAAAGMLVIDKVLGRLARMTR